MERLVTRPGGTQLWTEALGDPAAPVLLLVHGANAGAAAWPLALLDALTAKLRVIRYDHRDVGRSTWQFDEDPYPLTTLAEDAVAVLDAHDVPSAHVAGMSLGGLLVQLMLLDSPARVRSAALWCTGPLAGVPDQPAPPAPREDLLALWATMGEVRTAEEEAAWQMRHWRVLHGSVLPFDAAEYVALDERVRAHDGGRTPTFAHARADQRGLDRGAELAGVDVPVLVVEAPEDPAYPPPNAELLTAALPHARRVAIPGMGHALPGTVVAPLAELLIGHARAAQASSGG